MSSRIVISGYYGFTNAGDEAMLSAMIEAITELESDVQITVISGDPKETYTRHGVRAVYRLHYPEIIKAIAKSDLLISGGGSLLQDVTSDRSLYYYLSIMMLAKRMGKRVMLYGQGIGPVRGSLAQGAMRYIGNMADVITVRDKGSYDELKLLGVTKPPVLVTADPVMALHQVDKLYGRQILRSYDYEGAAPLIGISAREWKDWSHYKNMLAQTADVLCERYGARIVFLPMQYPEDYAVSRKIADRMKASAVVLKDEYTTHELLSLVGNLDIMIGIRLHALIFAAVMQVPLVGISYDPKVDRFLETIGDRHVGTLQSVTVDNLLCKVDAVWSDKNYWQAKRGQIEHLREMAFKNAQVALHLINGADTKE